MSPVRSPFPDAEDVVIAIVESLVPAGKTVQSTPENWTPPLIQVRQTGGTSDQLQTRPLVVVSCFGATYAAAKALAAQAEQRILAARASTVPGVPGYPGGVYVDKTEVVASPREINYEDPDKRRKTATYRLVMRRSRT